MLMVSINCITYNHAAYIGQAIESFLNQRTNFEFEILIHDDASTDGTAEIIRSYEARHPDKIKAIYQTENQYSKGVFMNRFNEERAQGKYVAICDGDDYWIDPLKLQRQVDYMEAHPDCTLCFHDAYVETEGEFHQNWRVIPWMPENRKFASKTARTYNAGELQLLGFIPSMSMLYPNGLVVSAPEWLKDTPASDGSTRLYVTSKGYAYYMPDVMGVYRYGVEGSATTIWNEGNRQRDIQRHEQFIHFIDIFDEYTEGKYHEELELSRISFEVGLHRLRGEYEVLRSSRYKRYLTRFVGVERIRPYLMLHQPHLTEWLIRLRDRRFA